MRITGMFIFGQYPKPDDMMWLEWVILNCFLILVNIVSLNLLISIIGDTYDKVQAAIDVFHIKTKADILLEIASFLPQIEDEDLVYLYLFHYSTETIIQTSN